MLSTIIRLPLTIIELHRDLVTSRLRWMVLILVILTAISSGIIVPSFAPSTILNGKGGFAFLLIGMILEYVVGILLVSSFTICIGSVAAKWLPGLFKNIDQRRGYAHLLVAYALLVIVVTCVISHHVVNRSFLCFQCWLDCLSPKGIPGGLFWGLVTVLMKSFVRVLFELRKAKEANGVVIKKGNDPEDHDDSASPPFGLAV
jgi:hypothetical protein